MGEGGIYNIKFGVPHLKKKGMLMESYGNLLLHFCIAI